MGRHSNSWEETQRIARAVPVPFMPGDGSTHLVKVAYVADGLARGIDGECAFCGGDPSGRGGEPPEALRRYLSRTGERICPFCHGERR